MLPILKIDLTNNTTEEFVIPKEWERDFLGGASLAARILYSTLTKELDPLSPESPLLFINGPLTGTNGPTTGRFVICGKSPATNLWAESNIGGFWGPELRKAGYDGLWITGKAQSPVYLWIEEGRFEVRDAARIWGKDIYITQEMVKEEIGVKGARVAVIGEAGERGILFSSICCDHGRMAGRTGMGAVMGSKNLKAVAVYGKNKFEVTEKYTQVRSEANRTLKQDNEARILHELGSSGVANYAEYLGSMPSKYYHKGSFEGVDNISGSKMTESILTGTSACQGCVIACGRVVNLGDGVKRKGPEYETVAGFGSNLLIDNLSDVVRLGEMCDKYGMDSISTSNTIGLAFHLFEMGKITLQDTGGLDLAWGSFTAARQLIHMIVRREGIGEIMSKGSLALGKAFGAEDEAVQVNGLEVAYHDPRGVSGMALSYATSPRGACHNQSDYFFVDFGHTYENIGINYFDRHAQAEKAANVARHQDWRTHFNSVIICIFANVPPETQVDLLNAQLGLNWTTEDLMKSGERAWNLKRAINNRMGLTRANDKLPKVFLEPHQEGGAAGFALDIDGMLSAYYEARGWDTQTGRPSKEKLVELGLPEIAKDLWG
ncbi:aldehyde ferredoxin oxidoreductase family protein [Candidatus Villigracilis affinis]|uniref:aldehyde ferredoxin oxidoreductase family protein n=1 Tax=Candidatus Villigracilis affinis TaxID=3140682 RepID=UPI001DE74D3F|nr:aldehyde ferredoxin oxidoreductase family protein [Anaerolineales bacterium]